MITLNELKSSVAENRVKVNQSTTSRDVKNTALCTSGTKEAFTQEFQPRVLRCKAVFEIQKVKEHWRVKNTGMFNANTVQANKSRDVLTPYYWDHLNWMNCDYCQTV